MQGEELETPAIERHRALRKRYWAAAGFAPAQPVGMNSRFDGRRDGYIGAARPKRARLVEGKRQLTPALARPGDEPSIQPTRGGSHGGQLYGGS